VHWGLALQLIESASAAQFAGGGGIEGIGLQAQIWQPSAPVWNPLTQPSLHVTAEQAWQPNLCQTHFPSVVRWHVTGGATGTAMAATSLAAPAGVTGHTKVIGSVGAGPHSSVVHGFGCGLQLQVSHPLASLT
jgi:hypothetical protein